MKWGVRRYQNSDGSLTPAGKKQLKAYKQKEKKRVGNKLGKAIDKYDTAIRKRKAKGKSDPSAQEKYQKLRKETFKKELQMIKKMSYEDMKSEKVAVGKQWLKAASVSGVLSIGASVVLATPSAAIYYGPLLPRNISNAKTMDRLKRYNKQNKL